MNPKGTKKKKIDAIHGRKKKGESGEAAAYTTRAQALRKLQVSLADFRKLCILKGVYPRDPKKKNSGADKTYYHNKDILFLMHEPILKKFFELKTFMKKWKRLVGRGQYKNAISLEKRKPEYTLQHLVRERYPSFDDAVRDLDDAVSMLALFSTLASHQKREIPATAVKEASQLYQEFQLYCIRSQALRKVFASIKGYYFQVEICGVSVTWLAPHQFAQDLPLEVDFRVMLTFLEFYRTLVKFANFKLYADLGLAYPPTKEFTKADAAADVASLVVEMRDAGKARDAQARQSHEEDKEVVAGALADFGGQNEEAKELQEKIAAANRMKHTFRGLRIFISREVPLRPIYFTLLCGGVGEVGWERAAFGGAAAEGSAFAVDSDQITHQIVDRPPETFEQRPGREYVQPQWVFDSFNIGCLLPIAPYAPGRAPPPHLSPFVDDTEEGYVPRQREILDKFAAEVTGADGKPPEASGDAAPEATVPAADAAEPAPQNFDQFNTELKAEAKGLWHSEFRDEQRQKAEAAVIDALEAEAESKPKEGSDSMQDAADARAGPAEEEEPAVGPIGQPTLKPSEEEEGRLRAKALMPKKHKRLLWRIEKRKNEKEERSQNLAKKRRKHEAGKDGAEA